MEGSVDFRLVVMYCCRTPDMKVQFPFAIKAKLLQANSQIKG